MNADLEGYSQGLMLAAPAARVFGLLDAITGLEQWWPGSVSGSAVTGGRLELGGPAPGRSILLQVEQVEPGVLVLWRVLADSSHDGQWLGTRLRFRLSPLDAGTTMLEFRHLGLTPLLPCFTPCVQGWRAQLGNLARALTAPAARGTVGR